MLSTTQNHQNKIAIRNYCIALGSVILLSTSLADLYHQPSRAAQQDRLDNFGRFVSAGLVSKAINH